MSRRLSLFQSLSRTSGCMILALLAVLALSSAASAQPPGALPPYPFDGHEFTEDEYGRGLGGYLSLFSIILYVILFWCWIKIVDWVNRDTKLTGMPYAIWHPVVFFPFLVGFFLFGLTIPYVGFLLTLATIAGPFITYVVMRNKSQPDHQKVFTPSHFRHVFARVGRRFGMKIEEEAVPEYAKGAPVELKAMGGETDRDNTANLLTSRQSPGFGEVKNLIADAAKRRGERVMLDYTQQGVAVKYQIDGVWHDVEARDRETADVMLAVMKTLANLDAAERRKRQDGNFAAEHDGVNYLCSISSQGTDSGERVILTLANKAVGIESLDEAGMRPKMQEQFKQLCGQPGFVLISSMPSGGLTTSTTLCLKSLDRFMRDFVGLEDAANPQPTVENIEVVPYDAAAGETPAAKLPSVFRKQPDVLVYYDMNDGETVGILCEHAVEDGVVIGTLRSKEAVEALLRVLMLKVPAKTFAPVAKAVLNQRLVRKLCDCKQPYPPNPDTLKKLGIPAGKVQAFYRPPPPPERPEDLCQKCLGVGYHGRTSIFELAVVDDKMRAVLVKEPKLETLRKFSRAAGNRGLQEEGIVLVAKGVTSLQELQRVLKG